MGSGEAMGKHGLAMAERGIGGAIASIFRRDSATADKRMEAESQTIETAADKLCADIKALGATQNTLATQIPAFSPYAAGDRMQCTVTHGTRHKANGAPSSSFTYALREGKDPGATTAHAAPSQTLSTAMPSAATSSQP